MPNLNRAVSRHDIQQCDDSNCRRLVFFRSWLLIGKVHWVGRENCVREERVEVGGEGCDETRERFEVRERPAREIFVEMSVLRSPKVREQIRTVTLKEGDEGHVATGKYVAGRVHGAHCRSGRCKCTFWFP